MTEQAIKGFDLYFEEINKAIIGKADAKKAFMYDLKERAGEFIDENPQAQIEDIISHFGTPEEIANIFFDTFGSAYIKKVFNWKRIIFVCAIVVIVLLAIYLIASFIDGHRNADGYIVNNTIKGIVTTNGGIY